MGPSPVPSSPARQARGAPSRAHPLPQRPARPRPGLPPPPRPAAPGLRGQGWPLRQRREGRGWKGGRFGPGVQCASRGPAWASAHWERRAARNERAPRLSRRAPHSLQAPGTPRPNGSLAAAMLGYSLPRSHSHSLPHSDGACEAGSRSRSSSSSRHRSGSRPSEDAAARRGEDLASLDGGSLGSAGRSSSMPSPRVPPLPQHAPLLQHPPLPQHPLPESRSGGGASLHPSLPRGSSSASARPSSSCGRGGGGSLPLSLPRGEGPAVPVLGPAAAAGVAGTAAAD